jgi:hypothetical protein
MQLLKEFTFRRSSSESPLNTSRFTLAGAAESGLVKGI